MGSDVYGNTYSDDNSIFIRAASNIVSIILFRDCKIISSTSSLNYAFQDCAKTLQTVDFESNSKLQEIQKYSFSSCSQLKTINFSNCKELKIISQYAFASCTSLVNLTLPSSVTTIETNAFNNCQSLISIQFPKSLTTMGDYSFSACTKLEIATFEQDSVLKSFRAIVFSGCTSLRILHLPSSLESFSGISVWNVPTVEEVIIDDVENNNYFSNHNGILFSKSNDSLIYCPSNYQNEIVFPDQCTTLYTYSFACFQRDTIIIPPQIQILEVGCFRTSALKFITIPSTVKRMDSYVFDGAQSLYECKIEFEITNIQAQTFCNCNFTHFDVPDGVTTIGSLCFMGNDFLKNVTLPSSCTSISGGAFSQCHVDLVITFRGESDLVIDSQFLMLGESNTTISNYLSNKEHDEIIIPATVKTIKSHAFYDKPNLEIVRFEANPSLTKIETNAFYSCSGLKTIEFMPLIETIQEYAFYSCSQLQNFSVGSAIQTIGKNAFARCIALTEFKMIDLCSHFEISSGAFSSCTSLSTVDFKDGLVCVNTTSFSNTKFTSVTFPRSLSFIGENAFSNSNLEEVTFQSDSLFIVIGISCFRNCEFLSNFTFPSSATEIQQYAFENTALKEITLPTTITTLGDGCFKSCKKLEKFTIQKNSQLSKCGYGIFEDCSIFKEIISDSSNNFVVENTGLFDAQKKELVVLPPASTVNFFYFPSTIKVIRQKALYGCKYLQAVLIPDNSVETIEPHAFENSVNLDRINLPQSVKSIGIDAFKNCRSLKCGVIVSSKNESLISDLISFGKLKRSALLSCSQLLTCKHKNCQTRETVLLTLLFLTFPNSQ